MKLAARLKEFKVKPRKERIPPHNKPTNIYIAAEFAPAWDSYLPQKSPEQSAQSEQTNVYAGESKAPSRNSDEGELRTTRNAVVCSDLFRVDDAPCSELSDAKSPMFTGLVPTVPDVPVIPGTTEGKGGADDTETF